MRHTIEQIQAVVRRSIKRDRKPRKNDGSVYVDQSGTAGTPEYKAWWAARKRCADPTDLAFSDYGGRGIRMCQEWIDSFASFLLSVGPRPSPGHWIDREDSNGNYEPGNCRWIPMPMSNRNKRNNVILTAFGETKCESEWADEFGMGRTTLRSRLKTGMDLHIALCLPKQKYERKSPCP